MSLFKNIKWNMLPMIMVLAWPTVIEQFMQTAVQYIDTAVTEEKDYNKSDYDNPSAVVIKKIARARIVVHSVFSYRGDYPLDSMI